MINRKRIRWGTVDFGDEEKNAVIDLVNDKDPQLTMGKNVYSFERAFASWLGSKYAVMVNSGTSALICALLAYKEKGLLPTSNVVTTSLTYPACWNAITISGFKPICVDIKRNFVSDIPETNDLFLGVNLFGQACLGVEENKNFVIEDACEALGSKINGKKLGTRGIMGVFSFYVAHTINTVEGGMVVTEDKELYDLLRSIRDNGRVCTCPVCTLKTENICSKGNKEDYAKRRWKTQTVGGNFKPTEIQAVIGLVKIKKLDKIAEKRHKIFEIYNEAFATIEEQRGEYIVPLAYPIFADNLSETLARLEKSGIECRAMFPCYNEFHQRALLASENCVLLPSHQELSEEDVKYIVDECKNFTPHQLLVPYQSSTVPQS